MKSGKCISGVNEYDANFEFDCCAISAGAQGAVLFAILVDACGLTESMIHLFVPHSIEVS